MAERFTKELLIVRHAESTANSLGILAGRIDPTPLTAKGRSEARLLQGVLKDFAPDQVISSPMMRCRQTAQLAGARDALFDERLIEMDYGGWAGKKLNYLSKLPAWSQVQSDPQNFTFPKGESFNAALLRIQDLMEDLSKRNVRRIALFTHGDISRMLINDLLGRELKGFQQIMIEPSSHSRIIIRDQQKPHRQEIFLQYLNRRESPRSISSRKFTLGGES